MKLFKKKHKLDSSTHYLKYKYYLDVYRDDVFIKKLYHLKSLHQIIDKYVTYVGYYDNFDDKYFDNDFNVVNYYPADDICEKFENGEYTLYVDYKEILKSKESFELYLVCLQPNDYDEFDVYTLKYNDENYIIYNNRLIKCDYKHIVNIYSEHEIIEFKNIITYYKTFDNNIIDESEIKKLILK